MSKNKCKQMACSAACRLCIHDTPSKTCSKCGAFWACDICLWEPSPTPPDPLIGELVEVVKLLVADYDNARGWRSACGGGDGYPDSQQITLARSIIKRVEG